MLARWFFAALILWPAAARADVLFENPRCRLVVGEDARALSLIEKATGRELCAAEAKLPVASVRVAGKDYPAAGAAMEGGRLVLRFAGTDTLLRCEVTAEAEWIVFRLAEVAGARPERLTLLQLPVAITQNVGARLNIAWDERTSVCLMAANRQAECRGSRRAYALLAASTQDAPGPKLEGAAVALIVAPTAGIRPVLRRASHAFGLLTNEDARGVPAKEGEDARGAYWFVSLAQDDAGTMVDYCRRSGIRQVMLSSTAWCMSPGHYLFAKARFPDEEAGLKRLVARLHAEGIKVGMHTFVSKVSKTDPYVTPKPDRRFWVDRRAALAGPVTAAQTEIRCATDLRDWPGCPVAAQRVWEGGVLKHQEVILDDEVVQYQSIGPEGRWDTFLGCKRGAWDTLASGHGADADVRHYGVDGCINGYIIDQETDLLDEVAERNAGVFNRCGFDMVYFDGGEDVDRRRFNYYASRFQEAAVSRYRKRPVIHMGTIPTHLLWHSFTRSATVDTYLNTLNGAVISGASVEDWPTVRGHVDKSVEYLLSVRQDLLPGELGWFGIWPKGKNTDGLQIDEFEYLLCKSLAYDAPVSLQTSFRQMESHPLTPELLSLFRAYDGLRMRRAVDEATRERLKEKGRDFALIAAPGRPVPEFVPVRPVEKVAGGREARACVGETPDGVVATLWHTERDGLLRLAIPSAQVAAADLGGRRVPVHADGYGAVLDVGPRRVTLRFAGRKAAQVEALLAGASLKVKPPTVIRIEAERYAKVVGALARGSTVGVREPEASGDVVVPTDRQEMANPKAWYCEYRVEIPHEGRWTLWARVRYPSGADESFGLALPGETAAAAMAQPLGNCGQNGGKWHWTGRGGGSTTPPPGSPIAFTLKKGTFVFRVYAREGAATPDRAPRLDELCLTDGTEPPEP